MSLLKPTLKDVAKLSGVSDISVSRVFRNTAHISKNMRQKVEAAARELNYTPNKIAGALASNKADLIVVVLPTLQHPRYIQILSGINSILGQSKYRVMLGVNDYAKKLEVQTVKDFLAWRPSGIILVGTGYSPATYQLLEQATSPVVEILNAGKCPADFGFSFSYLSAVQSLVDHWIAKGCQKVAYVETSEMPLISNVFKRNLITQLKESGIQLVCKMSTKKPSSTSLGISLCKKVVEQNPEVDVIFLAGDNFTNYPSLYNVMNIPTNVMLASFGQPSGEDKTLPQMDLIALPFEPIGSKAARFISSGKDIAEWNQTKGAMLPAEFHQGFN